MARAPEDSGIGAGRTLRSAGAMSRLASEFDRDTEPDIRDDIARLKTMNPELVPLGWGESPREP